MFRLYILILFTFGLGSAASLIGANELGMDKAPQNATIIRSGFASMNPALNAFENKTKFGTAMRFEYANAIKGEHSIGTNSFDVPSVSMVLPLGFIGAFGVGLEQMYFANNRLELRDEALNANALYIARSGIYELNPSYSLRLPSVLSNFALGVSYRVIFGNFYSMLERGKDNSWDDEAWRANNVMISKLERGSFNPVDSWYQHFGGSVHYHTKSVDWFFSYFPSIDIERKAKVMTQFSNRDTLQAEEIKENFKLPEQFASGLNFVLLRKHNLSLVYEQKNCDDNETTQTLLAEYKRAGTGYFYSPFLKRNDFGINAWYAEKYKNEATEYGASIFSDMLLGRRGTIVGLALYGGYRQADNYWDEAFFGIKLSLTGVGNWGTSSRRR